MSTLNEIENAVRELSLTELDAFRESFAKFDAAAWDQQFEEDVKAGRLDAVGKEALDDLAKGCCTER